MSGIINQVGAKSGIISGSPTGRETGTLPGGLGGSQLIYEEGKVAGPGILSSTVVPSYGQNHAHYVRIGNSCIMYYFFDFTTGATQTDFGTGGGANPTSGNLRVHMPYISADNEQGTVACKLYLTAWDTAGDDIVLVAKNGNQATCYQAQFAGISLGNGERTMFYGVVPYTTSGFSAIW